MRDAPRSPPPIFFDDAPAFRRWLQKNHAKVTELLVGFLKKAPGRTSLTYFEALDEALCFGWIDGVRRSLDSGRWYIEAKRTGVYSFEQRSTLTFDREAARTFRAHRGAWRFFQAQPPGYTRVSTFWVASAKKPETRARRLAQLIADSDAGRRIGILARPEKKAP